ncbi:sulfate permease [Oceaniradius stylonematis]|jgi:SulP family sulfate permease|uniref:Sulfate permease n=1 Tax=Oceaniradius stylonematis TaxID=2184161 RepID=A0A3A8APT2_9HYPH|nr:sulfate permease [Oceaniradius stylonematis]RKF07933.1 sulfate permease [Oceaniradius stylonematis]
MRKPPHLLQRYFPVLDWGRGYDGETLTGDLVAAVIVTIMLIPQSLAYALLAGLPPEMGLYASIVPIVLYALFGTSRALAVGPVAVVSLMTAAAIGKVAEPGSSDYIIAALTLAFMSGALLVAMGLLRLGFVANFLSHPVIAGFITASGILIAASQLKHLLGVSAHGHTLPEILGSLIADLGALNWITLVIGVAATAFLFWVRGGLKPILVRIGIAERLAGHLARTGPVFAVAVTALAAWYWNLGEAGVKLVGDVPRGLPPLTQPSFSPDLWLALAGPAVLISIIGFVESVSVAQTLAAKRRQRIDPDQELIGLGMANMGAGMTGGYPVTGGFARSVVNFDAGARTPAAGAFTAIGLAIASLTITPFIAFLPQATLAATIIVAVLSLVDFSIFRTAWVYSKADFVAVAATVLVTLVIGVEAGVTAGVLLSVLIHLYKTSKPHMAVIGQVPGTEHYRNVKRHEVITDPHILQLRVDESLYFANARYLEDKLYAMVADHPELKHVVLACPAVNAIDMSALESLEAINERLEALGVKFHLTEVKGPVMDRLKRSHFLDDLTGEVFLSQHQALCTLSSARPVNGDGQPRYDKADAELDLPDAFDKRDGDGPVAQQDRASDS